MSIYLKEVPLEDVSKWIPDFQSKSHNSEIHEDTQYLGIYVKNILAGFVGLLWYEDKSVTIIHGYLRRSMRHRGLPKLVMQLLDSFVKENGGTSIDLKACHRFKAYEKFAELIGYKLQEMTFAKELV